MVKGEVLLRRVFDKIRSRRIISGHRCSSVYRDKIGNRDRVVPRIALRIGVDANQAQIAGFNSRLLFQLAYCAVLRGLTNFDKTAGKGILAPERIVLALDQQDASPLVEHDAISGNPGAVIFHSLILFPICGTP